MNNPFNQITSVDFLDIGCSGVLDAKWSTLFPLLSYTGFDPNAEECERLNNQSHPYKTVRYLPYAIAGEDGNQTMYKTASIYCYSLLRPNQEWVSRFSFGDLFRETGTESVYCTTLNTLAQEQNLKADILKIDTQGLELPILKSGEQVLKDVFCIETETGFVEDYIGETTYAQIDGFLRSQGFTMVDINVHKVTRNNLMSRYGKHQPIWCQAVWLFDFVANKRESTREQALKFLRICQSLEYFDYGFELACYFNKMNLIEDEVIQYLKKPENWLKDNLLPNQIGNKLLGWLPEKVNRRLLQKLQEIADYGHTC
ncbi:MAG TPA: FkbM family methyltransferase [Cyanobacteria bacterium UBA8553]|nr:FkbM family methyltransferase [Cyanobacteria bacterium UBA8553]